MELIGDFNDQEWHQQDINGPRVERWGKGTKLLPSLQYGIETIGAGADMTIGVIITDGFIEDEGACMSYCLSVGSEIAEGKRKQIKLVMIGVGEAVDKDQLERFDDMFEGTGIDVDLWSAKSVDSIENEQDILAILFGELMDGQIMVASAGRIEDKTGQAIKAWTDGLPGKLRFIIPAGSKEFVLKIPPDRTFVQDISEVVHLV